MANYITKEFISNQIPERYKLSEIRAHSLAKRLGVTSRSVIEILIEFGSSYLFNSENTNYEADIELVTEIIDKLIEWNLFNKSTKLFTNNNLIKKINIESHSTLNFSKLIIKYIDKCLISSRSNVNLLEKLLIRNNNCIPIFIRPKCKQINSKLKHGRSISTKNNYVIFSSINNHLVNLISCQLNIVNQKYNHSKNTKNNTIEFDSKSKLNKVNTTIINKTILFKQNLCKNLKYFYKLSNENIAKIARKIHLNLSNKHSNSLDREGSIDSNLLENSIWKSVLRSKLENYSIENSNSSYEIQSINGSTRLEAKRQRRRVSIDTRKYNQTIPSEAEFLSRRESIERTMIVCDRMRIEPPYEGTRYTQIVVLEDKIVVEYFVTSTSSASLVGNIYLGIVQNVLPFMEAAFIDVGFNRNGVLYASEINWESSGLDGSNRKIEQVLKTGDYIIVQVSKDPIGDKGARLTTYLSLAGRCLVYVPGTYTTGISRKLPDTERRRLKDILKEITPSDGGIILRTASEGAKSEDIYSDVNKLQKLWKEIEAKSADIIIRNGGLATTLHEEPNILIKVIRDFFNEDFSKLIVSGEYAWKTISSYVNTVAPDLMCKLTQYQTIENVMSQDIFTAYHIDEQLAKAMDRKVYLPSGGTLIIDRTEAMTVIDVNTGKFTGVSGNLEQTVTRNNLEAAKEIVRQLRLRDIGGIVIIDFIDMILESNRNLVLRSLAEALERDHTRYQISEVTSLGLVQLTRKKVGTGLIESFTTTCIHCSGRGIIFSCDPIENSKSFLNISKKTDSNYKNNSAKNSKKNINFPEEFKLVKLEANISAKLPIFKEISTIKLTNSKLSSQENLNSNIKNDNKSGYIKNIIENSFIKSNLIAINKLKSSARNFRRAVFRSIRSPKIISS